MVGSAPPPHKKGTKNILKERKYFKDLAQTFSGQTIQQRTKNLMYIYIICNEYIYKNAVTPQLKKF